ncbi:MAG: mechanosensitive ion channel family protein [Bacteroidaceae bacterium]|nr:mechanosensitive ion channel family protein [Bacteroidaceae bacterium]
MTYINDLFHNENFQLIATPVLFLVVLVLVFLIYNVVLKRIRKKALSTKNPLDDFMIDLLRVPVMCLLFWIVLSLFTTYSFVSHTGIHDTIADINKILLILTIGWILIKAIKAFFYYLQNHLDIQSADNLNARKNLTRMKVFEGLAVTLVSVLTVAACLMSFEQVRTIGISLLTSAGIAGIIIGFAAQKSIATFLAGVQIAITQPIRLDDVVIVEGEWGRIEEITLTYVVVKIWDERRLVLPVSYFIEKPFQNWTRTNSNILGTIFLYTDYSVPVDALRNHLNVLLKDNPKWDKRVVNIQVTDAKERYMELRILLSSTDASLNWDLRVDIREKMIDYLNKEYPGCFVKTRIQTTDPENLKERI